MIKHEILSRENDFPLIIIANIMKVTQTRSKGPTSLLIPGSKQSISETAFTMLTCISLGLNGSGLSTIGCRKATLETWPKT